jgi:putative DeoR family transcriptional regulator (stage III sporulation protein D)
MKDYIEERILSIAHYTIDNHSTVRSTAKKFGISKSTVHKDLRERLPQINLELSRDVNKILDFNKSERHIRGGLATRQKYLRQAEQKI